MRIKQSGCAGEAHHLLYAVPSLKRVEVYLNPNMPSWFEMGQHLTHLQWCTDAKFFNAGREMYSSVKNTVLYSYP